jgi:hypothetical protein
MPSSFAMWRRWSAQVEALAAGEDGRQDFLHLGGRENKFHVIGRLLECFQQRVERGVREHVHLVDVVDLVLPASRGVFHGFAEIAHLFDAVV